MVDVVLTSTPGIVVACVDVVIAAVGQHCSVFTFERGYVFTDSTCEFALYCQGRDVIDAVDACVSRQSIEQAERNDERVLRIPSFVLETLQTERASMSTHVNMFLGDVVVDSNIQAIDLATAFFQQRRAFEMVASAPPPFPDEIANQLVPQQRLLVAKENATQNLSDLEYDAQTRTYLDGFSVFEPWTGITLHSGRAAVHHKTRVLSFHQWRGKQTQRPLCPWC